MSTTINNATVNRLAYPATDVTGMSATKLFKKVEVNAPTDYNGLVSFLDGLQIGFKRLLSCDEKCSTALRIMRNGGELNRRNDYMIAYRGSTFKGDLVSIWCSYGKVATKKYDGRPADYGVRISKPYLDKLCANSEALQILFSNFKLEDSNEYRGSFYSVYDLMNFFNSFAAYTAAAAERSKVVIDGGAAAV